MLVSRGYLLTVMAQRDGHDDHAHSWTGRAMCWASTRRHHPLYDRPAQGTGPRHRASVLCLREAPEVLTPSCSARTRPCSPRELDAGDFNWIAYDTPPAELNVKAKIRYRQQEQPATVTQNPDGTVHISFDEPQRAIARGQAVVLYDGDTVLGGGTIL